ncbi:MAG: hypothetical protein ABSH47_16340 [Bryobacteraceae bacterium]|jgi:hypothetical protein
MIAPSNEFAAALDNDVFTLPPLILHPFSDATGPSRLVESSRASLMLHGLLPNGEYSNDELERRLLDGRYCELRMVYYVGRDITRWIEQCMDVVSRNPEAFPAGLQLQSFAAYLVENSPECVQEKLRKWGVNDYRSIFARGVALNVMFAEAPVRGRLGDDFVRNYHRYADQVFQCYQSQCTWTPIESRRVVFELYASGEYSRMLEQAWGE